MTIQALSAAATAAARPPASHVIRQMEGLMWYTMLSEMHKTGLDSSSLGVGADAYESLFLSEIADKDFGKYDAGLVSVTLRQIGGRTSLPPAPAASELSPAETVAPPASSGLTAISPSGSDIGGTVGDAVLVAHATDLTRSIWPALRMAGSILGVPPVGLLAQAALETGWGSAVAGNNLFGIKATAGQASLSQATHEMINSVMVPTTARFRDYGSAMGCVTDYIRLIQSNFQAVTGQTSVAGFAHALQAGGFATDSNYASKIIMISQSPMMAQMLQAVGADEAPSD